MSRAERLRLALGELESSADWLAVAGTLEGVARNLPLHPMQGAARFNRALALRVASQVNAAAADIRAAVAIQEMHSCRRR